MLLEVSPNSPRHKVRLLCVHMLPLTPVTLLVPACVIIQGCVGLLHDTEGSVTVGGISLQYFSPGTADTQYMVVFFF